MSEIDKNELSELEVETAESVSKADKAKGAKSGKDKGDDKKSKKPSIFKRISKWFKEMKSELKKVQWPTWKQTLKNTGIVILCVIVVGVVIGVFDTLATAIINALIALFG